jgi:hypothetical protein
VDLKKGGGIKRQIYKLDSIKKKKEEIALQHARVS